MFNSPCAMSASTCSSPTASSITRRTRSERLLKTAAFSSAADRFTWLCITPGGRYQALYKHPGAVIRRLLHSLAGKLVVYATLVPVYYFAHVLKSKGKITWGGAKNLFHDYFVTPRVVFLSKGEIESWCRRCGVNVADYDANPRLNVHSFLLQKVG